MSVKIEIGIDPYTEEPVYYTETGGFGVVPFIANARYGKTKLVKLLYTLICNLTHRLVVAFDYAGDHQHSIYPSTDFRWGERQRHLQGLENTRVLGELSFKISDFGSRHHWGGIGFAEAGARDLAYFAKRVKNTDLDDPQEFAKMLQDIPVKGEHLDEFNAEYRRYRIHLPAPMNEGEYRALVNRFAAVMDWFVNGEEADGGKGYIEDYGESLMSQRFTQREGMRIVGGRGMIIEIPLDVDERRMSLYTAKILEDIEHYLTKGWISPLFIIEEADRIMPNPLVHNQIYPSLWSIEKLCRRHQRHNPQIMIIGQNPSILYEPALEMWHTAFLGICPDSARNIFGNRAYELTKKLRWDHERNYREFVMVEKGGDTRIFVPHKCPCA